jgi:hypothetical protein
MYIMYVYITPSSSSAYYCPHCWGTGFPYGSPVRITGHNPPRGPSTDWWVLTTANTVGTDGLTCFLKHVGAQDNAFLVTYLMTDQCCLASTIVRRAPRPRGHWALPYIASRPFPMGVGRDPSLPLDTHAFRFLSFHQIPHTRSPVSGTLKLAFL